MPLCMCKLSCGHQETSIHAIATNVAVVKVLDVFASFLILLHPNNIKETPRPNKTDSRMDSIIKNGNCAAVGSGPGAGGQMFRPVKNAGMPNSKVVRITFILILMVLGQLWHIHDKIQVMNTDTIYREELLEHYHSPQNFGALTSYSISSRQLNPFCGDEIEMFIQFSPSAGSGQKSLVKNISFFGKGCAISIASGSILTEYVKNKSKKQLTKIGEDDMLSMLGVTVSETRKKCALLALAVLKDCL